jgi:phospholipid/cholesterol/gamma-HCH transport system substrate-binding protein
MMLAIKKHLRDFVAIIVLFVIAIAVSAFIIYNQDPRPTLPLVEAKPKVLRFELSDAQAVTPGQGQTVRVAGVQVGKIRAVQVRSGVAIVKTEIEKKFWDKLHIKTDATGLLRPRTGLKDMFIELDPGGRGVPIPNGYTIPVQNTAPDIDPDEVLSAFDTDTRAYLQLLINGAGKGLRHRGDDLNRVFKALGPTQRDLNRVASAVAERRRALKELIHRYGDLTNALADKDREIKTLVTAADATFRAFASQQNNISLAVAKLPPTLQQTTRTLVKTNTYADVLRPTLHALRPPFRQLDTTNHQVLPFLREAYPILKNRVRPFVRVARPEVRQLRPAAVNLARATPGFTKSFHELNRFFNMAAYNPGGAQALTGNLAQDRARDEGFLFWVAWVGMNTDSLFSTSDATGAFRRVYIGFDCETVRAQLEQSPAGGPLLGLSNILNDTGLCGGQNVLPLPKGSQDKKAEPAQTPGKPATPNATPGKPAAGKPVDAKSGGPAAGPSTKGGGR